MLKNFLNLDFWMAVYISKPNIKIQDKILYKNWYPGYPTSQMKSLSVHVCPMKSVSELSELN